MTVRLRAKTLREVTRLAKAFDYVDRSAFVRDFIETAVSGDMNRLGDFLGRMMRKAAEAHQASLPGFLVDQDEKKGGRRARAS
jgi:hypothetical protein